MKIQTNRTPFYTIDPEDRNKYFYDLLDGFERIFFVVNDDLLIVGDLFGKLYIWESKSPEFYHYINYGNYEIADPEKKSKFLTKQFKKIDVCKKNQFLKSYEQFLSDDSKKLTPTKEEILPMPVSLLKACCLMKYKNS